MSTALRSLPSGAADTAEAVLADVNSLVDRLRARAPETERLRRMHPDNLRDLTEAGVFRLAMPTDVGGHQADEDIVAEVLAQISRGCPSTGWMCTIMLISNVIPALLADEAADDRFANHRDHRAHRPRGARRRWVSRERSMDLEHRRRAHQLVRAWVHRARRRRLGTTISADAYDRGKASGQLARSRNGRHGHQHRNGKRRVRPCGAHDSCQRPCRGPLSDASLLVSALLQPTVCAVHQRRECARTARIARGAMDCFMQTLPTRGAITYTAWPKAAEAPLVHHQLAKAQYHLEAAEMFTSRLSALYRGVLERPPTILERAQARAYIGHIASLSRACINQLFEASSASHALLTADIQRYFRDINVLHQHAAIQPNSGDEVYDRMLAGLDPNSEIV
jgi:3-hydroxy-9,10-secoandrosta-1,3,5(10)-triene-9,17-dione monooxygenase